MTLATTTDTPVNLTSFITPPRLKFAVTLTRFNLRYLLLFLKAFSKHRNKKNPSASEEVYLELCLKEYLSKWGEILIGVWVSGLHLVVNRKSTGIAASVQTQLLPRMQTQTVFTASTNPSQQKVPQKSMSFWKMQRSSSFTGSWKFTTQL